MTTGAVSLCCGGGLVDVALTALGLPLVGAVEIDPAIAGVYAANHGGGHLRVEDLAATDFTTVPPHRVGWASPSCQQFSQARAGGREGADDRAVAAAIVRYLRICRPAVFVLENVRGYRKSASLLQIVQTLLALDYAVDIQVVNAADYGVPQTRERLILRARAEGGMPPLPAPVPWVGWYSAIADILDTLPPSAFAPWQLARLPTELTEGFLLDGRDSDGQPRPPTRPASTVQAYRYLAQGPRAFIVDCQNHGPADAAGQRGLTVPDGQAPMFTVTSTATKRQIRAFLVDGQNAGRTGYSERNVPLIMRPPAQPAMTLSATGPSPRAFLMSGHSDLAVRDAEQPAVTCTATNHANTIHRAWLERGRVVKMTPRALARFQSVPDTYSLPDKAALACQVIGNGVPVLLARAIVAGLLHGGGA